MNIWEELPKPFFVLAPMDDVTDTVFRRVVAKCARPDLMFTEFANADGLQSPGRPAVEKKLRFYPEEQPLIAQLWGMKPENYFKTVKELADNPGLAQSSGLDAGQGNAEPHSELYKPYKERAVEAMTQSSAKSADGVAGSAGKQSSTTRRFAGVDVNMGCPVPKVFKMGACSALMNNRDLAHEIIVAAQAGAAGQIPISVKTRIGVADYDEGWIRFLLEHQLDALIIHGRTVKQLSKVPNNWEIIGKIRQLRDEIAPGTKLVGNGDVNSRQEGLELAEQHGLDGIMIGRGVFKDPFIFAKSSPWADMDKPARLELFRHHIELFAAEWGADKNPAVLKKFAKIYVSGWEGASELRGQLMTAQNTNELLTVLAKS